MNVELGGEDLAARAKMKPFCPSYLIPLKSSSQRIQNWTFDVQRSTDLELHIVAYVSFIAEVLEPLFLCVAG